MLGISAGVLSGGIVRVLGVRISTCVDMVFDIVVEAPVQFP